MTAWRVVCEVCGPLGSFTDTHEAPTGHVARVAPPGPNTDA